LVGGHNLSNYVDISVGFAVAGNILFPQLVHQSDRGDLDGALDTARAIVHTSRPFTDNYFVVSTVCDCRWRALAAWGVERVLAQGEPSANALDRVRQLFDEEVNRPILLGMFRRERAWVADLVQSVDDDKVTGQEAALAIKGMRRWTGWAGMDEWIHRMSVPRSEYVALLRHWTWVVEQLKESPDALQARAAEWAALRRQLPEAAKWRADADAGFIDGVRDDEALFRAALVAIAAEQFRRVEGHWPAALDELVPEYVTKLQRDPFDLQPLRLARRDDGIVIYSVGPNQTDDGGDVVPGAGLAKTRGRDIGIRLWDVAKRRQPPLPPASSEKGK